mgnify:FL=1
MVAYCNDCNRYVNQYCERCGGNFGVQVCERYGCGGRMLCPICGGNNLTSKREEGASSKDFAKKRPLPYKKKGAASDLEEKYFREKKKKQEEEKQESTSNTTAERHCPLCGYPLQDNWKFCPECGVSLIKK